MIVADFARYNPAHSEGNERAMSAGFEEEIRWWRSVLQTEERPAWMAEALDPARRGGQSPPMLFDFVATLALARPAKVLDVGCGPLSPLAWGAEQGLIEVVAVDPLADEYNALLDELGVDYPIRPAVGRGEALFEQFGQDFDFVYTRNALDHAHSPARCIEEICSVLRPGGLLYLEGFFNEGTRNRWGGLHQWDLAPACGVLTCTDPSGRRADLTGNQALHCRFQRGPNRGQWFRMVFERLPKALNVAAGVTRG